MIDGEALWTSGKLNKVFPVEWRVHYANWIPMAEINGVFEADPFLIHYKIYAYLCPDTTKENVQDILDEFKRVDLIRTWKAVGKNWGYFVGMEKPGRLPFKSQLDRGDYKLKSGIPNPPISLMEQDTSESQYENNESQARFRLGLGKGIGLGEEEFVSFKNTITDKARELLGVRIFPGDQGWSEMSSLARVYGQDRVIEAFVEWAELGDSSTYPLTSFVRIADGVLRGDRVLKTNADTTQLINELVSITNGEILFDQKQQMAIGKMLSSWNYIDIKSAFREFYGQISGDDFALKHAARKFVETAEQLLTLQKRRKEEARKQSEMLVQIANKERSRAVEELAEIEKKQQEEANLIEESL